MICPRSHSLVSKQSQESVQITLTLDLGLFPGHPKCKRLAISVVYSHYKDDMF